MRIQNIVFIRIHTLENSHTDFAKMWQIKIHRPCKLSRSKTFNVILHNVALEIDIWSNILIRKNSLEDI